MWQNPELSAFYVLNRNTNALLQSRLWINHTKQPTQSEFSSDLPWSCVPKKHLELAFYKQKQLQSGHFQLIFFFIKKWNADQIPEIMEVVTLIALLCNRGALRLKRQTWHIFIALSFTIPPSPAPVFLSCQRIIFWISIHATYALRR